MVQAKSPINKRARAPVRPSKTMLSTAFNAPEAMVGAQKVSFSHGTELGEHHWYPPLPSTHARAHARTHAHRFPFAYRRGLSGPGSLYGHTFRRHHPFRSAPPRACRLPGGRRVPTRASATWDNVGFGTHITNVKMAQERVRHRQRERLSRGRRRAAVSV